MHMKWKRLKRIGASLLLLLPLAGYGTNVPVLTTRERTVLPLALPCQPDARQPSWSNVDQYVSSGYGAWTWGPGTNEGRRFDLMRSGYTGVPNTARLLSFFSISDIHITDKETPAQLLFIPNNMGFNSPVMLSTTHVLDAAVKTINALHQQAPFDFGLCLGDVCNCSQYNELRWFIDVMDGTDIMPSSGEHRGANTIDYQKQYKAAGLDRSIPWYQVIGNHDQFWMGIAYPNAKLRNAMTNDTVLNIGTNVQAPDPIDANGMYMGVMDGSTPYGDVIHAGLTNYFSEIPTVAADPGRHTITPVDISSPTGFIAEFFHSASQPSGHGFSETSTGKTAACYAFMPKSDVPLKVIVLDDTCKSTNHMVWSHYALGSMDTERLAWLTNELQSGQASNQLMIVACHVPINVQTPPSQFVSTVTDPDISAETNLVTEATLMATLHHYPNLILLMAGHRHGNAVTAQPAPDPAHPEYGFWEVETPSLRDFPQQFRTWEILLNNDQTISILTTDVDPAISDTNAPAWKSRGYAIGAARIYHVITNIDTTAHVCNAELVKALTPAMQARLAGYGTQAQYQVSAVALQAHPSCAGYVLGGGNFPVSNTVSIAAQPAAGWRFGSWNDGNTNAVCSILVPAAGASYTATFAMDLGAALDASNLTWSTGGAANWSVQTATTHDGVAALRSGALGAGQWTWCQTTVNGPGSVLFWWKVSSAPTNSLQFYVNNTAVNQISGEVGWTQCATFLSTTNAYTLTWMYVKNTSAVSGSDAGWVDQVNWLPCAYATNVAQVFYQDPTGLLASWVLNSTGGFRFARMLANTGGWGLKAAGDLDGDGVSDLLFQDRSGRIAAWFMNADGSVRSTRDWLTINTWELKACGDYLGAGHAQLFFQTAAGATAFWVLDTNGNSLATVPLGNMGGWKLRGAGDLDGDHKAELFWQDAGGQVAVWYHNPDGSIRGAVLGSTGGWVLSGVADLDGDGVSDLLWQTPDGATGKWFMNRNSTTRTAGFWWNTAGWQLKAAGR